LKVDFEAKIHFEPEFWICKSTLYKSTSARYGMWSSRSLGLSRGLYFGKYQNIS